MTHQKDISKYHLRQRNIICYIIRRKVKKLILGFSLLLIFSVLVFAIFKTNRKSQKESTSVSSIACQDCNVIIIGIDTLRQDHLGTYGYLRATSQSIDSLAKDSLVFENAYSQSNWTLPSFASMITSKYPHQLNVEVATDLLSENHLTLTEVLKENGYTTAAIEGGQFFNKQFGFGQGFDEFIEIKDWEDAAQIQTETSQYLDKNKDKSFFLFIRPFEVHDPYKAPDIWNKKFSKDYQNPADFDDIKTIVYYNLGRIDLTEEQKQQMVDRYDAEIAYTDDLIGNILKELDRLSLSEKTIIIITADHGEEFGERGIWGMHLDTLYDELVRIPLIIKAPNIPAQRITRPVALLDLAPTILELAQIPQNQAFEGKSLFNEEERPVFSQIAVDKEAVLTGILTAYENFIKTGDFGLNPKVRNEKISLAKKSMARISNWKLIENFDGSFELYNLDSDPREKTNLYGKNPQQEEFIKQSLNNFKKP